MKKRSRQDCCISYIKAVQQTGKYNEYLQVMKEFKSLPYTPTALDFVAEKIKDVFRDHSNLILSFNVLFLPKDYAIGEDDGADQKRVLKLKSTQRVEAADSSKAFLLQEGDYHQDYRFFENVRKEKFRNPDEYKRVLKCLYLYSKEIISRDDLVGMVRDLLQYGTVFPSTVDKVHEDPEKDERETCFEASASKRRKIEEPSRIDRMSKSDDNPSYQPSTEKTSTSGRTALGVEVLNDCCVSVEILPTYQLKKNIYEKKLFKCEDDRCERDRQKELVKSTIGCVEQLLQDIADNKINLDRIHLEEHFKALNLGCIKRLYGESWQSVVVALPGNAVPVLHGILTQLQRKLEEAEGRLSETYKNKMCAVYSKNFRKSLDHGNSSCEQQDTTSSRSSSDRDDASTSCPNLSAEAAK
ncbi:hypothetical protein MKW94_015187 [Papaver nudicaule]|uniref:Histone deacetylase interacting domain-containing protein n=1 Tax=Papaver nudicaule TaxID=74823 RepID=A0AA41S834_PAPNU|nr:hypothetical protein [Papaver nudicaule]